MKIKNILSLFLGLVVLSGSLTAKEFEIDRDHTSIGFRIRHLLTHVSGRFTDFSGKFHTDESGALVGAEAIIKAKSINTDNTKRDNHLRSGDFFEVEKYPDLKFVSESGKIKKGKSGTLSGKLTIHGVTKPVDLDVEWMGEIEGPGVTKAGASAKLIIDRKDYGLTWSKTLETGGVLVGDKVEIQLDIEGNLKPGEKVATGEGSEKGKPVKAKK